MRVLVNALSARMGGIVTYTRNLMTSLAERGVDATFGLPAGFHAPGGCKSIFIDNLDHQTPLQRFIWEQFRWRRLVARNKPDLLFSSANYGLLYPPVPQVLLVREGGLFDPFYLSTIAPSLGPNAVFDRMARRRLIVASARNARVVMTPSETMRDMLLPWAPGLADRLEVNHYGTLPRWFDAAEARRPWKNDGVLRLLFVSAYYPHKQPGLAVEATARLNAAGVPSHLTLTMDLDRIERFTGGGKDWHLVRRGIERGDTSALGTVLYDDLPGLFAGHDVFVFPSLSETFGHPLVEAMSAGIPVLAADTPIHREICGDAAVYFAPTSIEDLAAKILALDSAPERRTAIVEAARRRVSDRFRWESHVDRLIETFERVDGSRN